MTCVAEACPREAARADPSCVPFDAPISNLDLDITKSCNLQCAYCFKGDLAGRSQESMPLDRAMAAVDWLLDVSRDVNYLNVNLRGGEPLMAFDDTIRRLVPYAKRRGLSRGKTVQFGITSNLTLVTPDIVEFTARWGMGWHLSIDGVPEVELSQRLAGNRMQLFFIENFYSLHSIFCLKNAIARLFEHKSN